MCLFSIFPLLVKYKPNSKCAAEVLRTCGSSSWGCVLISGGLLSRWGHSRGMFNQGGCRESMLPTAQAAAVTLGLPENAEQGFCCSEPLHCPTKAWALLRSLYLPCHSKGPPEMIKGPYKPGQKYLEVGSLFQREILSTEMGSMLSKALGHSSQGCVERRSLVTNHSLLAVP